MVIPGKKYPQIQEIFLGGGLENTRIWGTRRYWMVRVRGWVAEVRPEPEAVMVRV